MRAGMVRFMAPRDSAEAAAPVGEAEGLVELVPAAAQAIQSKWRSKALRAEVEAAVAMYVSEPSLARARAAQLALLPQDQYGKLLPLNCSLECFKCFGSGVYCYMIWIRFMKHVFLAATVINLPTMFNNLAGEHFGLGAFSLSKLISAEAYTLGNADDLNGSYGPCLLLTTLLFLYALVHGRNQLLHAEEEMQAEEMQVRNASMQRQKSSLSPSTPTRQRTRASKEGGGVTSASQTTVMLTGLPPSFGQTSSHVDDLRDFVSQWGDGTKISVARAQRTLLLRMRARSSLVEALHYAQAQLYNARNPAESSRGRAQLEEKAAALLARVNSSPAGLTRRPSSMPRERAASMRVPTTDDEEAAQGGDTSPGGGFSTPGRARSKTQRNISDAASSASRSATRMLAKGSPAKPKIGSELHPYLDKVDSARKALVEHDRISRQLMSERQYCSGIAFVTFHTSAEAIQCLTDLYLEPLPNTCWNALGCAARESTDAVSSSVQSLAMAAAAARRDRRTTAYKDLLAPTPKPKLPANRRDLAALAVPVMPDNGRRISLGARLSTMAPSPAMALKATKWASAKWGRANTVDEGPRVHFEGVRLGAQPAPEPSDVQWADLATTPREMLVRQLISTAITMLIICIGTSVIVAMNLFAGSGGAQQILSLNALANTNGQGTPRITNVINSSESTGASNASGSMTAGDGALADSEGTVDVPWLAMLIYNLLLSLVLALPTILGNVIVFATCPPLADIIERHGTFSGKERMIAMKMAIFQVFNTVIAAFSFLVFQPNFQIGHDWYRYGGGLITTVLSPACDGVIIPCLLDLITLDQVRHLHTSPHISIYLHISP